MADILVDADVEALSQARQTVPVSTEEEAASREVSSRLEHSGGALSERAMNALRRRMKQHSRAGGSATIPARTTWPCWSARCETAAGGGPRRGQHPRSASSGGAVVVELVGDDEEVAGPTRHSGRLSVVRWLRCSLFHHNWQRMHGGCGPAGDPQKARDGGERSKRAPMCE